MIYFMAGANNDQDGWDYVGRFRRIFENEGIRPFNRLNFSEGKFNDIHMTAFASCDAWFRKTTYRHGVMPQREPNSRSHHNNMAAFRAGRHIHEHYADAGPRERGERQLNMMGYSYGSVLVAHSALIMCDNGMTVDNLILVGAPIPTNSQLYVALTTSARIRRVIRHDIPGDDLSNPTDWLAADNFPALITGALQNLDDTGPHFDLARPDDPATPDVDEGAQADARIRRLARRLYAAGVR